MFGSAAGSHPPLPDEGGCAAAHKRKFWKSFVEEQRQNHRLPHRTLR